MGTAGGEGGGDGGKRGKRERVNERLLNDWEASQRSLSSSLACFSGVGVTSQRDRCHLPCLWRRPRLIHKAWTSSPMMQRTQAARSRRPEPSSRATICSLSCRPGLLIAPVESMEPVNGRGDGGGGEGVLMHRHRTHPRRESVGGGGMNKK